MPTVPLAPLEDFDQKYGLTMRLGPNGSQDGWMEVCTPPAPPTSPSALDTLRADSWGEVATRLVEKFLVHVSPIIPIVVQQEVASAAEPLLHAIAAVAAARSDVPPMVFDALRHVVRRDLNEHGESRLAW